MEILPISSHTQRNIHLKMRISWTSLVVQWLKFCIPNAGGLVQSLVRELDHTCHNQIKKTKMRIPSQNYGEINIRGRKVSQLRPLIIDWVIGSVWCWRLLSFHLLCFIRAISYLGNYLFPYFLECIFLHFWVFWFFSVFVYSTSKFLMYVVVNVRNRILYTLIVISEL